MGANCSALSCDQFDNGKAALPLQSPPDFPEREEECSVAVAMPAVVASDDAVVVKEKPPTQEDLTKALDAFAVALQDNPQNASAWAGRGEVKLQMGNHAQALLDFNHALHIDPSHSSALARRAELLDALGHVGSPSAARTRHLVGGCHKTRDIARGASADASTSSTQATGTSPPAVTADSTLYELKLCTDRGDWAAAERVLISALEKAVDAAALWRQLQNDSLVKETRVRAERLYATKMTLAVSDDEGWRPGPEIKVDWRTLCPAAPEVSQGVHPQVQTRWKVGATGVTIQIQVELPAQHPSFKLPFAQGLFAMFAEVPLMHKWSPLLSQKYPPHTHSNSADLMVFDQKAEVRFITHEQGLLEMHRFFLPEGIIVQRTEYVLDASDSRIKSMSKAPGYKMKEEPDMHSVIAVFGAEKTVIIITQENQPKTNPPVWMCEKLLWWVLPYVCKAMLRIGGGIFEDKDYGTLMTADEVGFYRRIRDSYELGKQREATGAKFSAAPGGRLPLPEDLGLAGELCKRIEQLEKPGQPGNV